MKNTFLIAPSTLLLLLLGTSVISWQKILIQLPSSSHITQSFDGDRAYQDVEFQLSLGPRFPETDGHRQIIEWIAAELSEAGWEVEIQTGNMLEHEIFNVVGKRGRGEGSKNPWIIIGAHYDTRIYADQDLDPEKRMLPVTGANDGATGVAVLLGLARILPDDLEKDIWLVFFDSEDNGNIPGWDWILGSRTFVQSLQGKPDKAIIVDMIGDAELDIYMELGSDPEISAELWAVAAKLGYPQFKPMTKYHILDDHVPFLEAGIRAVDIIDFDYPHWHTTEDTIDKVSAESLEAVGETLRVWLLNSNP
jgi:glutaminyl-peptide cyclotransferase